MKNVRKKGIIGKVLAGFGVLFLMMSMTSCSKTPEEKAEWVVKKIQKKLELNENQNALLLELKESVIKLRLEHKDKKDEKFTLIKEAILSDRIDPMEIIDKVKNKIDTKAPKILQNLSAFHASLTLEQKQKVVSLLEKRNKNCRH
jgi:hypothetical protein